MSFIWLRSACPRVHLALLMGFIPLVRGLARPSRFRRGVARARGTIAFLEVSGRPDSPPFSPKPHNGRARRPQLAWPGPNGAPGPTGPVPRAPLPEPEVG